MQEFCGYPDLLRHSASFIEHFARTFLAGCVKAFKHFLRWNPSPGMSAHITIVRQRFSYGDDCRFGVQGLAKASPCLTPFLATSDPSVLMRILAYIRGLPCSSNIFSKKGMLTYMVRSSRSVYGPISKLMRGPTSVRWTAVSPDGQNLDNFYLARPGADEVQLD